VPASGTTLSSSPVAGCGFLAAMSASAAPVRRRLLLAVGALALLDACTPSISTHWQAALTPTELPGDSHPEPSPSSPSPSPSSSWQIPTPATPTPGVCPTVAGVVQRPGGPQHYLPCSGTNIALTIDDGPDPRWTPQILALLARYQIHATFCVIGRHATTYPDLIRAIIAGGHQIANHTQTHPIPLTRLPPTGIAAQLAQATDAITAAGAPHPTLFRAPGGAWSPAVLAACTTAGMRPLDWSVDPRDWSRPGVPHIVDTILTKTRPGSIILDHDGGGNRQQTIDALTIALPRLIDAGYHFTQTLTTRNTDQPRNGSPGRPANRRDGKSDNRTAWSSAGGRLTGPPRRHRCVARLPRARGTSARPDPASGDRYSPRPKGYTPPPGTIPR